MAAAAVAAPGLAVVEADGEVDDAALDGDEAPYYTFMAWPQASRPLLPFGYVTISPPSSHTAAVLPWPSLACGRAACRPVSAGSAAPGHGFGHLPCSRNARRRRPSCRRDQRRRAAASSEAGPRPAERRQEAARPKEVKALIAQRSRCELELELIETQMRQKPVLREEVHALALCVCQNVK